MSSKKTSRRPGLTPPLKLFTRKQLSEMALARATLARAIRPVFEGLERRQLLNGALDTAFGATGKAVFDFGAQDMADGMAVLADGSFVAVGESNGQFALARFNPDGSPDTSFGSGGKVTTGIGSNAHATSVVIDGSGRIVVGGYALIGSNFDFALARYDATGAPDSSFGTGGVVTTDFAGRNDRIFSLTIQPTGEIVAVGTVMTGPATVHQDFGLARYSAADGSLDTSFDGDGRVTTDFGSGDQAFAVAYDANLGRLVVAGGSGGNFALARYALSGSLDNSFDGDGQLTTIFPATAVALSLGIDSSGRYVAAGHAGGDFALARYNTSGALDTGFDGDGRVTSDFAAGFDQVNSIAFDGNDRILAAGLATVGGNADFALARYNADGSTDTSFGAGTGRLHTDIAGNSDTAAAVAIQPNTGKILVVGTGNGGASQDNFAAVRYEAVAGDVWVNDTWNIAFDQGPAGLSVGDIVNNAGEGGTLVHKTFGFDAFTTVSAGVAAVATGGSVRVIAGTYTDNLVIDRPMTIRGQSQGNTFLHPAVSGPNPGGGGSLPAGASSVFLVEADDVTIRTLTIDGDNPSLTSGVVVGGADIDARNGIITDHNAVSLVTNLHVHDVTVKNVYLRGIQAGTDFGTFNFHHNTIDNVRGAAESIGIFNFGGSGIVDSNTVTNSNDGIAADWSAGTQFTNNTVSGSDSGIHTHNMNGFGGASVPDVISGNTVSNGTVDSYGIWVLAPYAPLAVSGNTVTNVDVGMGAFGSQAAGAVVTFSGNTVSGGVTGLHISTTLFGFGSANVNAVVNNNNSISGASGAGILVEDESASHTATADITGNLASINNNGVGIDVDGGAVSITNNTIAGNTTGVRVRNGGSLTAMTGNFVTGSTTTGIDIDATAGAIAHITANEISSTTGDDIVAGIGQPIINASGNWFGSALQSAISIVGDVDVSPWLNSGDADGSTPGFQASFADVNVGVIGAHSGSAGRIKEGIDAVDAGGNVYLHPGTYLESDISVNKSVVIDGVGSPAGVVVAPAVADGHLTGGGQMFNPLTHNAFVIRSSGVTIKDLTIDGDAGVGGAGSKNFFGGIVYDYNLGQAFNNLQAKNLTIRNLWRVGIYFDGGINALSTGHTVMDNTVSNIEGGSQPTGLLMLQASGTVLNNTISNVGTGIGTNYIDGSAYAPIITLRGNTISAAATGMNLSGLASGSVVGGAGAGQGNTITMTGGDADTGIVVQWAAGSVTVQNNTITGDDADSGIWLYRNSTPATAPLIIGNTITSSSSTGAGAGEGTGIFITDDGSFFTESSGGHSYATLTGNTITGFVRGVDLYRNEDNPAGGFTVNVTIDGNNTISGNGTGIRVFDSNGTADANAVANITGNSASISGNAIGIDVEGGTATITGNHIFDNGIGVQVRDGGTAAINSNNFAGGASSNNGTDIRLDATAPSGITGAAMSGNSFAGDNFFIDNESAQNIDVLALAGNTFAGLSLFRVEDRMHHRADSDRPSAGKVTVVANEWFVTDPTIGVNSTDSSIQHAINVANSGDTINIEGGTYAEHVTVNKAITLDGEGTGPTPLVNWTGTSGTPLIAVTSTNATDDITVLDIGFSGGGVAGDGIRAFAPAANFGTLTVDRSTFSGFTFDAISISGNASTGIGPRNIVITNSSFSNNGSAGSGETGDISIFQYNGDATLSNLTLVGSAGTTGARIGIQMRGVGDAAGNGYLPMGNVSLSDIDISGSYRTSFLGIQRYSNANNLTMNNVALGSATSEVGGTFGALLRIDAVGFGSVASPASINLGNTHFRGLAAGSAQQAFLEFAPDNNFTFLRADATNTRWDLSSGSNITASSMTLAQAFEATDRMLDYVKPNHPTHGAFKGWAELQNGKAFNTALSSNINRGIEMVDSSGTVHVQAGTYTQQVQLNRAVTLAGAQAGVDARGRAGSETILTTNLADETLGIVNITAAGAVIDGFTIEGDGPAAGGVLLLDGVTSSNAARGVVVEADNVSMLNNIVQNTYRRGAQFWVNAASAPIGGLVHQNEFNVIGADAPSAANSGDAILAFSDPTVTDNAVNLARTGITFIQVYAPNVTPITISGNTVNAINGIALNETSSGIPTITISGNTVNSGDGGVGLQLWTVDGNVTISGNAFTGTGVGDRGVYAWDGTANDAMNLTISGGSFSGYQTGVHLTNEEQAGPFGPSLNNATLTLDGVTITAGSTGVFVEDTAAGTFEVRINVINESNISTGGTGTGVRVSGPAAKARIVDNDNSITNNARGVDVDGGVALVQGNDLNGNTIGVLIRNGGIADLGQNGAGTNFTGLGISTGGNDFSGYTTAATASAGAIVNLNDNAPNNAAGRQGLPNDVPAFNNLWAVSTAAGIENVIYHDLDLSSLGFVDYAVFGNFLVSLTNAAIPEGGTTTVNGSFTNVGATHTVTINWGDGSPDTVVNLASGEQQFSVASPAGVSYTDDPDGPVNMISYGITVTVRENPANDSLSDTSLAVEVSNVAPVIALSGNASVNEGSVYTLTLGAVTDPGNDTVTRYIINWGDGNFVDITGNPENAVHTHTYSDGPQVRNITVSLFDEDAAPHANTGNPHPLVVTVSNVAPTGNFFNGGPVPEGSNGLVGFGAQFDPSPVDVSAGFLYSYDFNNDGDFTDAGEFSDVTNAAVGVPAIYLADGPGTRTIRGRIKDKDGGFTDYTTTITIFNVTPFVNGGPDITVPANIAFTQSGTFADPGADSPWVGMVDYDINDGNPPVPLTLNGFNFTLSHTYTTPGTYTIRIWVTDKDGATGTDDVMVNVGPTPTFQVNQFLFNPSGFTLKFNRAVDTSSLNLYDGLDGLNPSSQAADITLVGNNVGVVRGSLVWDPATNVATFVRTGGPLVSDSYTLTVRSGSNAFKDTLDNLLDGNADGTGGDDYVTTFNASNPFQRTLSIPDFARGPDAGNNINVPNTGSQGIPVSIDNGSQVRSVDFTLHYNPSLLSITGAQLAAGLPGDWSITANLTTPGNAVITVFGTSTDLPGGPQNLVKLIAHVPDNAAYTSAGVLRFSNMVVTRNDATTISTRGDAGLHKVVYFGDVDADRAYTGFDAGLISRVVVGLDSGFNRLSLTDPVISADIDSSGALGGIDASFVAQKAALLPRPEIPDLPGVLPPLVPGGVDPLFSAPDNKPGRPGGIVSVPISIDDASNTLGYNLTLEYDTNVLDLANADVTLGSLYAAAGGWSIVANVDDATGLATLVFWRSSGVPMPAGSGGGEVVVADFQLDAAATHGAASPIELDGNPGASGLLFTFDDGSILVDAVAPTVLAENYKYQTAPHTLSFQFSEDVSASLSAGDFVVVNNTTSTTLPAGDFIISYDALTNTATLTYTPNNGVLPDGSYTVTITAADVTDDAGNPLGGDHLFNFFFLMGDANHDGVVNLADFNILAANFGQSPRDFTQADFNYDGVVNLQDFNILAARFGASLSPSGSLTPPTGGAPQLPRDNGSSAGSGSTKSGAEAGGTTSAPSIGASTGASAGTSGGTSAGAPEESTSLGSIGGSLALPPSFTPISSTSSDDESAPAMPTATSSPSSTTTASRQNSSNPPAPASSTLPWTFSSVQVGWDDDSASDVIPDGLLAETIAAAPLFATAPIARGSTSFRAG